MSRAKRWTTFLAVVAGMPLIMGAGGNNPPISATAVATPSTITVTVVVDPHPKAVTDCASPFETPPCTASPQNPTSSGRSGRITLLRDGLPEGSEAFDLVYGGSFGALGFGCTTDAATTQARLGDAAHPVTMTSWVPPDVVVKLFAQIGVNVYSGTPPTPPLLEPIITKIKSIRCVQSVVGAVPPAGFLLVEAEVGFYAEPGTTIPKK